MFVDGGSPVSVAVNGFTSSVVLKGLTGGPHTLAASYTGDNNFAPSNTTLGITVAKTGTSVSLAASGGTVFQNPPSAAPGAPITFTAVVTPTATTIPTGSVTFSSGGVTLGTAVVTPTNSLFLAVFTSAALPAGSDTVTATYSGDVNYSTSSANLGVIISPETYTVTPAANSLTMGQVGSSTIVLQITSISGYAGYVGLVCTGLPANAQCGFSPNGLILQPSNLITAQQTDINGNIIVPATYGSIPVTVTVNTGITPTVGQPVVKAMYVPVLKRKVPVTWAVLGFVPFTLLLRRKVLRRMRAARLLSLLLVLVGSALFFSGCGSDLVGNTPTGTYKVTITATSTATGYAGTYAPGCVATGPSTAVVPSCTQTVNLTLVIQ